jgi:outer membrane protein assembly factor BamD
MKRLAPIIVASILLPMAACSLNKKPAGGDYYAQGQLDFADREYKAAIENYQDLIDKYPFSPYAEDAELKIGLAHYQEKDYAEAVAALDDFQRMHPTSKKLDLATYYIALSYYDQIGREDQDQTRTELALKRFQEIEQRFPESDFAELASEHLAVCREMLARNQMIVGNYYFKRANFRAAESRFAELMQKYPDTPVAPDALLDLAISLEKEGKKYSAAQAFAAVEKHFPHTSYAKRAHKELNKLHQPVDTEEDPLPLVLAESGYGGSSDENTNKVVVRQRSASQGVDLAMAAPQPAYGLEGSPVSDAGEGGGENSVQAYPPPGQPANSAALPLPSQATDLTDPSEPAAAAPAATTDSAPPGPLALSTNADADAAAAESKMHQVGADASPASAAEPSSPGPATLKTLELSSNDPPLSVIVDLSGPVSFDKHLNNNPAGAIATVLLKEVIPAAGLQTHLVFDKSIFKDCDITTDSSGTTITLNTRPVANFSVVPLDSPPRLLITFTPEKTVAANDAAIAN